LVTFAPVPPAGASPEAEAPVVEPALFQRTLVVADAEGKQHFSGAEALRRLLDPLPVLPVLFGWILLPGVRSLVDAGLERVFSRRAEVDRYLELEDEAKLPSEVPPAPTAARGVLQQTLTWTMHVVLLLLMTAEASQVLVENRAIPERFKPHKRPDWMTEVVVYPRLFQGWSMFAPAPPTEDGRVVVDGRTEDGRHLDPLTGQEPVFEVQPKGGFRMNQIWGDFHRRIGEGRFAPYHDGFKDFLLNHHELTGRPQDRLVAFEVWYVSEFIPPPGQPKPPATRRRLFSHGTVN
jgi:hypothetical protein